MHVTCDPPKSIPSDVVLVLSAISFKYNNNNNNDDDDDDDDED